MKLNNLCVFTSVSICVVLLVELSSALDETDFMPLSSQVELTNRSKIRNELNVTTIINKPTKLPCFIEDGRKFIWMQTNRDEILSIDNNLITSDKRFSIEQSQSCLLTSGGGGGGIAVKLNANNHHHNNHHANKQNETLSSFVADGTLGGCWVYLIINSVSLFDEGTYLCQIDTMSSTLVNLNILGILFFLLNFVVVIF